MDKLEIFNKFGRYVQRKVLSGKPLVTVKELWELIKSRELSLDKIGWWLRRQGFQKLGRRVKDEQRSREWFLNKEGIEVVKKKNRLGFKCYHCGWTGYYDLLPDEQFAVGSSSMIEKIGDREQWKICYCPVENREDIRVHLNITLDGRKLKKRVAFSARKVNPQGVLVDERTGYHGPGCLDIPDNLKGQW